MSKRKIMAGSHFSLYVPAHIPQHIIDWMNENDRGKLVMFALEQLYKTHGAIDIDDLPKSYKPFLGMEHELAEKQPVSRAAHLEASQTKPELILQPEVNEPNQKVIMPEPVELESQKTAISEPIKEETSAWKALQGIEGDDYA